MLIVGGAVLIIAIIVINIVTSQQNATSVYAEKVSLQNLVEEVSASGYIQPVTRVNITSEVTAEIISILIKEGDEVRRGQLLVQLDTVQLQTDLDQRRYSLDEMLARMEASKSLFLQAEENFERQKTLFDRDLISETVLDNAEYSYKNYKYSYEAMINQTKQARARLEKAQDNLDKTKILSPMDGVITYLDAEVGEIAAAQTPYSQGRTLMTVSNLDTYEVEVDVDETEIVKVAIGQEVKIEIDAFVDTTFKGEVIEIGNTATVSSRNTNERATNFKVKVLFLEDNPKIRPGMSATVDIITNKKDGILSIPYGAVVMRELDADSMVLAMSESGDSAGSEEVPKDSTEKKKEKNLKEFKGVFIKADNEARFVAVETGIADQKNIEITSGLSETDTVITGPYRTLRKIKHGEEIEISKTGDEEGEE
jgi:HlyD family secretion protein